MDLNRQIEKARKLKVDQGSHWVMERRELDIDLPELDFLPEMLFCVAPDENSSIGGAPLPPDMAPDDITILALDCMLKPVSGPPRRPEFVTITGGGLKELKPILEQLGIEVKTSPMPHPMVDGLADLFTSELTEPSEPPYTTVPGVKEETIREFFEAAVAFYKAKPWKLYEYEMPARMMIEGKRPASYWAVVMGTLGQELGLSAFRSVDDLLDAFFAEEDAESMTKLKRTWKMGFSYVDIDDIGAAAEGELMSNRWPIAGKKAYPSAIVHTARTKIAKRPNNRNLQDMTALTAAFVEFVKLHRKEIGRVESIISDVVEVEVAGETLRVTVDLPAPEFVERLDEQDEWDEDEDDLAETGMVMTPFHARFPEVASKEIRVITSFVDGDFPAGEYGFLEYYCNDPDCDCRRTMIEVVSPGADGRIWAVINYGWESAEFYRKMGFSEPELATGAFLDPTHIQSEYAEAFLHAFKSLMLEDKAYVSRLKKHYKMVKNTAGA